MQKNSIVTSNEIKQINKIANKLPTSCVHTACDKLSCQ